MSVKLCSIISGSSGNCTYIESGGRAILIDAGGSLRKIKAGVESIGGSMENIAGVFITHEHNDHITGLKPLINKHKIPVISNKKTLQGIFKAFPDINTDYFIESEPGQISKTNDFEVLSFKTSHDSAMSVGYHIKTADKKVTVVTDTGTVSDEIIEITKNCDALLIESNYDEKMLKTGSYPYYLIKRILADTGHLDNKNCAEAVMKIIEGGTTKFILGHLSEENNKPEIAAKEVFKLLKKNGLDPIKDIHIQIAPRFEPCEPVIL